MWMRRLRLGISHRQARRITNAVFALPILLLACSDAPRDDPPAPGADGAGVVEVKEAPVNPDSVTTVRLNSGTAVEIQPGTFASPAKVTVAEIPSVDEQPDDPFVPVGSVYRIDAHGAALDKPATIELRLSESASIRDSQSLVIARLEDGRWQPYPTERISETVFRTQTDRFSDWGLVTFDIGKFRLAAQNAMDLDVLRFLKTLGGIGQGCQTSSLSSPEVKVDNSDGNSLLEACITAFDGKTATVAVKNWKTFAVELGWSTSASVPPFRLLESGQSIALLVDTSAPGPLVITATSISRDSVTAFALDILCSALPYCKTVFNALVLLDQVVNGYVAQEFGRFVDQILAGDMSSALSHLEAMVTDDQFLTAFYDLIRSVLKDGASKIGSATMKEVLAGLKWASIGNRVDDYIKSSLRSGGFGTVTVTWGAPTKVTPAASQSPTSSVTQPPPPTVPRPVPTPIPPTLAAPTPKPPTAVPPTPKPPTPKPPTPKPPTPKPTPVPTIIPLPDCVGSGC